MDSVHAPVRLLSVTIDKGDPNFGDAHGVNGDGATDSVCRVLWRRVSDPSEETHRVDYEEGSH